MDHPSEETLKRFAAAVAAREENRAVVAHLIRGCTACAQKLQAIMEPQLIAAGSYDAALDQLDQGLFDRLESIAPDDVVADAPRSSDPSLPKGEREN